MHIKWKQFCNTSFIHSFTASTVCSILVYNNHTHRQNANVIIIKYTVGNVISQRIYKQRTYYFPGCSINIIQYNMQNSITTKLICYSSCCLFLQMYVAICNFRVNIILCKCTYTLCAHIVLLQRMKCRTVKSCERCKVKLVYLQDVMFAIHMEVATQFICSINRIHI